MTRIAATVVMLLVPLAAPDAVELPAATPSTVALVDSMRQAGFSDGFELRMNITTVSPIGHRSQLIKAAVIGQFGPDRQRLTIRGISPEQVRNRSLIAERSNDARIKVIEYGVQSGDGNPYGNLFDSGIVLWDMFSPWWDWPKQQLRGRDRLAGHDCTVISSQSDADNSPIREVVSCVDPDTKLSLRTQLFDSRHALIRTISVGQVIRKQSGYGAAKRLSIVSADNSLTEVEVYGGDEHYAITAATFAPLDSQSSIGR